jgi:iron-sulfur cluster assembly accessory protein
MRMETRTETHEHEHASAGGGCGSGGCGCSSGAATLPAPPVTSTVATGIALSDAAATKIRDLLDREQGENPLALRVAVQPGGCSGLRYALYFDDEVNESDIVSDFGGVRVVIDEQSVPFVQGATVDYLDTLQQQGFAINNPQAKSGCACGDSFGCS